MGQVCFHTGEVVHLKAYQDTEYVHVHNLIAYNRVLIYLSNLKVERRFVGRGLKLQLTQNTLAFHGVLRPWTECL